jgi:hypothetical protein
VLRGTEELWAERLRSHFWVPPYTVSEAVPGWSVHNENTDKGDLHSF